MKTLINQDIGLLARASLAFLLQLDFGMQLRRTVGGRSNLRGKMKGNEP
jgi:hypothetical protein